MRPRLAASWARKLPLVIAVWMAVTGLVLLEIAPHIPKTFRGWVVLVVAGPPVYFAIEWFGEWLGRPKPGGGISVTRVVVGTIFLSVYFAGLVWWVLRAA